MADGGVSAAIIAIAAEEAAMVAAAEAAAATAATAAAGTAAGTAATAAGTIAAEEAAMIAAYEAAGLGAGEVAAGTALSAEELAMVQAMDGGTYGAGNPLLGGPGGAAESGSGGHQFMSDYDKYKNFAQQGFKNIGKAYNKMPSGTTQMLTQGLLGPGAPPQQTNVTPPRGGGGQPSPMPGAPQNQLPQVTPYAPTVGGGDDQEMKKRLALMRQAGLLGV